MIFIAIFFYSLFYWPNSEDIDKTKLNDNQIIGYDIDILGLEVPVYKEPVKDYKPMGGLGLKIGLFVIVAFHAFYLVFNSYKRVEPFHYAVGSVYSFGGPVFIETGKKQVYQYELRGYQKEIFRNTFGVEFPLVVQYDTLNSAFRYLKEPYFQREIDNSINWTIE